MILINVLMIQQDATLRLLPLLKDSQTGIIVLRLRIPPNKLKPRNAMK
jgi:hypothetical protein